MRSLRRRRRSAVRPKEIDGETVSMEADRHIFIQKARDMELLNGRIAKLNEPGETVGEILETLGERAADEKEPGYRDAWAVAREILAELILHRKVNRLNSTRFLLELLGEAIENAQDVLEARPRLRVKALK